MGKVRGCVTAIANRCSSGMPQSTNAPATRTRRGVGARYISTLVREVTRPSHINCGYTCCRNAHLRRKSPTDLLWQSPGQAKHANLRFFVSKLAKLPSPSGCTASCNALKCKIRHRPQSSQHVDIHQDHIRNSTAPHPDWQTIQYRRYIAHLISGFQRRIFNSRPHRAKTHCHTNFLCACGRCD